MPGAVTVTYEREPCFFGLDAVLGERAQTLVARPEAGGPPVALASRATRTVLLDGEPTCVGYLSGLRVRPDRRGRSLVGRGWTALRALHEADPVPFSLLAVTAENERARRLLALGRGDAPALTPLAEVVTLALVVHRRHRPVAPASAGRLEALRAALGPRHDLFPAAPLALPGLEAHDHVAVDGAALSLWDPGAVRQTVVRGYAGALRWSRPVLNAALRAAGAAPLPAVGERLRSAFVVGAVAVAEGARALDRAVEGALGLARARGLAFVVVGLDARHPALALLRRRPHVAYRSTLFAAVWPGGHLPPFRPPIHAEIATY